MTSSTNDFQFSDSDDDDDMKYTVILKVESVAVKKLTFTQLVEFVKTNKQGYEVISDKCVPYYDFEKMYDSKQEQKANRKTDFITAMDTIKNAYSVKYPDVKIYAFDASGCDLKERWKNSFHFRLRGCGYLNQGSDCLILDGFDKSVYKTKSKRQLIRMPLCSKEGEDRPFKPTKNSKSDKFNEKWLIQNTDTESFECEVRAKFVERIVRPKQEITRFYTYAEIEALLDCINYEDTEYGFQEWTRIIWGLRNMSDDYKVDLRPLAHEFSKGSKCSSKYDEAHTNKIYDSNDSRPSTNPVGIGTFIKMAKEINPKLYMEWRKGPAISNISVQSMLPDNVDDMQETQPTVEVNCNTFNFDDDYNYQMFHKQYNNKSFDELESVILETYPKVISHILKGKGCYIKKLEDGLFDVVDSLKSSDLKFKTDNGKTTLTNIMRSQNNSFGNIKYVLDDSCPKNSFNIWSGFQSKIVDVEESEGFKLMKSFIMEVWANDDTINYNYIISWLAGLVTNLRSINKVALVMVSGQGCGKGTLLEFMEYILRKINVVSVVGVDKIVGRFNTILQGKRLICINEMSSTKDEFRKNWDCMKSYITDPTILIEPKGINSYDIDNISNFIMFTNHRDSIIVEETDRRYAIFEMSHKYMNNNDYFGKIRDLCFNQSVADEFYTYLMNFQSVPLCKIPNSDLRSEMINLSKPNPMRFLEWIREDEDAQVQLSIENNRVRPIDLYNSYKGWCNDNGERCFSNTKFGTVIAPKIQKIKSNGVYKYIFNLTPNTST